MQHVEIVAVLSRVFLQTSVKPCELFAVGHIIYRRVYGAVVRDGSLARARSPEQEIGVENEDSGEHKYEYLSAEKLFQLGDNKPHFCTSP